MANYTDPTNAIARANNIGANNRENWTRATVTLDGKATPVEWAGRVADDGKLDSLKVREPGRHHTARVTPSANGAQVELMSSEGAYYRRDNGHVSSPLHTKESVVPAAEEFNRSAALVNGLMTSPEYRQDTAGVPNSTFTAVADKREVKAAPAVPAPNR